MFIKIWQVWHQRRETMVLDLSITVCLASMEVLIQRSLKNWQSDFDPRCYKLLLSIVWRGEESGLQEKENHKRNIGCLEPFLEAAPQVRCTIFDLLFFLITFCKQKFFLYEDNISAIFFLGFDQDSNFGSKKADRWQSILGSSWGWRAIPYISAQLYCLSRWHRWRAAWESFGFSFNLRSCHG